MDGQTGRRTDGRTAGRTGERTGRWTEGPGGRKPTRQTDSDREAKRPATARGSDRKTETERAGDNDRDSGGLRIIEIIEILENCPGLIETIEIILKKKSVL